MKKKNINIQLDKLSRRMHRRTGYSVRHMVLAMRDDAEQNSEEYTSRPCGQRIRDFIAFNSETWSTFCLIIGEACK